MPHSILAPVPTHRAVITGSKRPFYYDPQPPARIPAISRDTVKARLGIDPADTSSDDLIDLLTEGVTLFAENYTGLKFINQLYRTGRDFFTSSFELRRAPFVSVSSILYLDVDSILMQVSSTVFGIMSEQGYSRIVLKTGKSWPGDKRTSADDSIFIKFTAGFGAAEADVPADIRMALLAHIVSVYTKAGDCCDEAMIPSTALNTYKQRRILSLKIAHSEG